VMAPVAAGMGVSIVPQPMTHLQSEGLAYRPLRAPVQRLDVIVAQRRDSHSPVLLFSELSPAGPLAAGGAPPESPRVSC